MSQVCISTQFYFLQVAPSDEKLTDENTELARKIRISTKEAGLEREYLYLF